MIEYEFHGGNYRLYMNGYALFNFYEKFGQDSNILEVIEPVTKEAYEALIWVLCELSRQGEMYARFLGLDAKKPLEYMQTLTQTKPSEYVAIKEIVTKAIAEGFRRDHPDEELEEDAFLQEFEAQKKTKSLRPSIFVRLRRALAYLFMKA